MKNIGITNELLDWLGEIMATNYNIFDKLIEFGFKFFGYNKNRKWYQFWKPKYIELKLPELYGNETEFLNKWIKG